MGKGEVSIDMVPERLPTPAWLPDQNGIIPSIDVSQQMKTGSVISFHDLSYTINMGKVGKCLVSEKKQVIKGVR